MKIQRDFIRRIKRVLMLILKVKFKSNVGAEMGKYKAQVELAKSLT